MTASLDVSVCHVRQLAHLEPLRIKSRGKKGGLEVKSFKTNFRPKTSFFKLFSLIATSTFRKNWFEIMQNWLVTKLDHPLHSFHGI